MATLGSWTPAGSKVKNVSIELKPRFRAPLALTSRMNIQNGKAR
jgi:hypothetical protein